MCKEQMRFLRYAVKSGIEECRRNAFIQGGHSSAGSFTYPIALSTVLGIWIQKIEYHWAYNPRITSRTNTAVTWDYTDQGDSVENLDSFLLIVGY